MKIHVETKPKGRGFVREIIKSEDRIDLAEVLINQLDDYELDWAAVYINGRQIMYYDKVQLIKALQYDKYE